MALRSLRRTFKHFEVVDGKKRCRSLDSLRSLGMTALRVA